MTVSQNRLPGWNSFVIHPAASLRLVLWILLLLVISRFLLIHSNRQAMETATTGAEFFKAFFVGFRFDLRIATMVAVPAIERTIDPNVPSFSVIMTASNHRPFSIDLAKEECEVKVPPTGYDTFNEGNATLRMLGHHLYSDKCVGEFVERMNAKAPESFFALTADHWGRGFPGPRPTSLEQALVPLVLWQEGRKFPDVSGVGGSHYDLGATMIELVAPEGTTYHAIGKNLLGPEAPSHALSRLWVLGPGSVTSMTGEGRMETLDGEPLSEEPSGFSRQKRRYNLVHGLSWWRMMKGNELPEP